MRQLSHLIALIFLLSHLTGNAQPTIQQDACVATLLKQVDAKRPGLMMFGRKADRDRYVNMAVLVDSTHMLTWFTCHGQAFDVAKLPDDVYDRIKSGDLNPFNYYKYYFSDLLSHIRDAAAQFRKKGQTVLKDTNSIYRRIYTYPPVQQARSTLQKEVALEKLMSNLCLQLSLFDSRTPQQLQSSDSFQLRLQLAGKMVWKGDTTIYYNTNPLSSASRIMLSKQAPGKMFVYDWQGQLADSVPLKAGKYTALLIEKEDVFLLYRGWLELQSQQAIARKEDVTLLLNREHTMLYKPVYWEQNKQHLQRTLLEVQEQVDAVSNRVIGLIVPVQNEISQLLATIYRDKPAEISYSSGLGFAYSVVYTRGNKRYELTDHRGNVMAVVSDKKKAVDENTDGIVEYYNADVVNAVDYLPFGAQMPGRVYGNDDKYKYGFNGKENDNEVKGEGNQQDYGMRIYDPRVGRFLSIDPLTSQYPELTPYQFASNRTIDGIDIDGKEFGPFEIWLEKKILGTTHLKNINEGFQEGVRETVMSIPLALKNQIEQTPLLATVDPGIAKKQIDREVNNAINSAGAPWELLKFYTKLVKDAAQGDDHAIGRLGFEAAMLFLPETKFGRTSITRKMAQVQRTGASYAFKIENDAIKFTDESITAGRFDFVIMDNGELRIGRGHDFLSKQAETVRGAGEIYVNEQGKVEAVTNNSGHYKPNNEQLLRQFLDFKANKLLTLDADPVNVAPN